MEPPEWFNLRWNSFETNTRTVFMNLREEREFYDVTVVADCGKQVEANKVVLAGGSTFFHKILKENPHPHPLIYLKGVGYEHLSSVLDFVYTGEASISKDDLNEFLDIAQDLKVKGLMEKTTPKSKQTKSSSTSRVPLQGQDKDKVPCLSPVVSHPHCVVTDTSASHKAQIGAEKAGLSSRTSHPHRPGETGLSARTSHPHSPGEAGLSSRTSHPHSREEAGLSSRTSHPHHPGEPGLSSRASHPHRIISSVSQGQVVEEKAAPSHSMPRPHCLKSVPRKSQVFVEEVASPLMMSRRPPTPHEKVAPSPRMLRLRSVKSAPSHGPVVADEAAPSPVMSHPHTVASSRKNHHEASPLPRMSHPHTVTSSRKDHHETSPSPGMSHPHTVTFSRADHHEASPLPRMSHPHTVASSHLNNVLSQSNCEDHHDNSCDVKVEVSDAEQYNVAHGNNDHGEDGFEDNEKFIDFYQSAEGAQIDQVVTEQKSKEEVMDSCNGVVISETAIGVFKNELPAPGWYEVGEKMYGMIPAEELENRIEMDNKDNSERMFDDTGEIMDTQSTHDWGGRSQDDKNNMIPNEQDLNEEINSSEEKYYRCSLCTKTFVKLNNLKKHRRIHAGKKPYQYSGKKSYQFPGKKPNQCSGKMSYQFPGKKPNQCSGKKSYQFPGKKPNQCSGKKSYQFPGKKPNQCSGKKSYQFPGKKPNQCSGKKSYQFPGKKPNQCPVCLKICSKPSVLKSHIRVHTGEKPYQCLHCNKSFSLAGNLKTHEMVHSGEKPFQCVRCFKRFSGLSHMNRHMERKNKCSIK